MQRYLALDDRVAWAYFEFTEELLSGETIEEWITLNGKQGDGQEGTMNVILSFTVWVYMYVIPYSGKSSRMVDF